jgi:hypothetical protein
MLLSVVAHCHAYYTSTHISSPSVSFAIQFTFEKGAISFVIFIPAIEPSFMCAGQVGTFVFLSVVNGLCIVVCIMRPPMYCFLLSLLKFHLKN